MKKCIRSEVTYEAGSERNIILKISDPDIYEQMDKAANEDLNILISDYSVDPITMTVSIAMKMVGVYRIETEFSNTDY